MCLNFLSLLHDLVEMMVQRRGLDRNSSSDFSVCQTEHCWQVEVPEINYRSQCGGGELEKTLALNALGLLG